jgi:hypothetical protein
MTEQQPPPLLTARSALVILIGVVAGVMSGVLAYLAADNPAAAVLVGASAAGGALGLFQTLIGHGPKAGDL